MSKRKNRTPAPTTLEEQLIQAFRLAEMMVESRHGWGNACITCLSWIWAAHLFEAWAAKNTVREYTRMDLPGSVTFSYLQDYVVFREKLDPGAYAEYSVLIAMDLDLQADLAIGSVGDAEGGVE
jgi:hypothetical protein